MTRLFFSNTANSLSLSAGVVPTDTVLLFSGSATGWPGSPCKAVIDPDTDLAEVVLVTALGPSSFTVVRGQDGTTAQTHSSGATVEHRWSAAEADEANLHANLSGGVHGITGDVVGTDDVQTLENKTVTAPVIDTETVRASDTSPAAAFKAATTGTANIAEFQDPSGVRLSRVGQHGEVEINTSDPTKVPLLIKGDTGLSRANIEIHDDVDHVLYQLDSKGRIRLTPQDASASAIRYVPPNGTDLAVIQLRNAGDTADEFVVTTLGRISNAAIAWLRGNSTEDPLRYPLDGSKFKVDSNGNLTLTGDVVAGGNLTADNVVTKVAYASGTGNSSGTTGEIKDQQVGDVTFTAVAGRKYRIKYVGRAQAASGTNPACDIRVRDGGASSPTNASTQRVGASVSMSVTGGSGAQQVVAEQTVSGLSAGTHTIAAFIASTSGDSVLLTQATGQLRELMVYDEGTV